MFGAFKRPVGAAADVKELEYVSALHQTSSVIHTDGTVSAQDVLFYLRSRFGIDITSDDAIDIVRGLAGTSRLPLPSVEKKVWRLQKQKNAKDENESDVKVQKKVHKRRPRCCKAAADEDQEDELAALEAQLKSLKETKTDTRKGWEFPAMQRQIHREVPKNVTSLVRYDMVHMASMLLIPSLLRIERHRFKREKEAPPPRAPLFAGMNIYSLLWNTSKMAKKIITVPVTLVQKARHNRLSRIKDSLRPKPDTLILDVLRILLGSLEKRDLPMTRLSDFVAHASSSVSSGATAATGKGRHFPELRVSLVTRDLIRRILENLKQEEASQDDKLIDEMMELVGGEGAILDERAFAHALTSDVTRWPLECEDDITTTFFDVYGFGNVECNKYAKELTPEDLLAAPSRDELWTAGFSANPDADTTDSSNEASDLSFHSAESDLKDIENEIKSDLHKINASTVTVDTGDSGTSRSVDSSENTKGGRPLRMGKIPEFKPTAGYIDYACDSFSSTKLVPVLFGFFLALSALVVSLVNYTILGKIRCSESFGCTLVHTIVNWGVLALVLCVCGLIVIMPISLVNQSYLSSYREALFAIGLLIVYMAGPLIESFLVDYVGINVSQEYLEWRDNTTNMVFWYSFYIFGGCTFLASIRAFGSMFVPKKLARRYAILRFLFVPNDILRSTNTKRSGTYKLNEVLRRAYGIQIRSHKHTKARNKEHETMLSFLLYGDEKAKCGGLLWAWKNFHSLNKKEGVWFHARLAVGQCGQIVITAVFALVWWIGTQSAARAVEENRDEIKQSGGRGAEWGLYFMPEAWMIYYSFIPAGIVCLCVLVLLILIQYPSTASMVLKYRSGYLPSLHDPQFQRYRKNPVYIYYNTGNMLYAAIGSAGLFFVLVGGLLFLLFWPPTSEFMILLIAWGLGLGITVGLKMVLTMFYGTNFWKGLYRRRPAAANVSSLAYECWHLGLGGGVMISRLCQFLLAAAFWIGRIDSQFLSNDVVMFGYYFDTVPQKYVTEVLVHEAHRHPYIERLGAIYLMRLKHGEYFGTDAGAMWRTVFTLTLMPWLVKFSEAHEHGMAGDSDSDESDVDEANDNWQLPGDSDVFASNDDANNVKFAGNVPWSSGDDVDGFSSAASDNSEINDARELRRVSWNAQYASAKSFKSINGN